MNHLLSLLAAAFLGLLSLIIANALGLAVKITEISASFGVEVDSDTLKLIIDSIVIIATLLLLKIFDSIFDNKYKYKEKFIDSITDKQLYLISNHNNLTTIENSVDAENNIYDICIQIREIFSGIIDDSDTKASVCIMRYNPSWVQNNRLKLVKGICADGTPMEARKYGTDIGYPGASVKNEKIICAKIGFLSNFDGRFDKEKLNQAGDKSTASIPIKYDNKIIGILNIGSKDQKLFDDTDNCRDLITNHLIAFKHYIGYNLQNV